MKQIISIFFFTLCFFSIDINSQTLQLKDGKYLDNEGLPYTGVYREFHENGAVKLEIELIDGIKDGKVNLYFEDGKIHEVYSYKQNLMDGLWLTYNTENIKTAEANYLNDKKDGTWKIWDDNGNLLYLMQYKNGEKTGTWIKYNDKGEEIARKTYN